MHAGVEGSPPLNTRGMDLHKCVGDFVCRCFNVFGLLLDFLFRDCATSFSRPAILHYVNGCIGNDSEIHNKHSLLQAC